MKSLKERLADKKAREEKEAMKLSNEVKCFTVRLPWAGFPCGSTKGDIQYFKERAAVLVNKLTRNCSSQFYQAVKDEIARHEKEREETQKKRNSWWEKITYPELIATQPPSPAGTVVETRDVPTEQPQPELTGVNPAFYGKITLTGEPVPVPNIFANGEPGYVDHIVPAGYRLATEPAMTNEAAQQEFNQAEIERIKILQQKLEEIQTELNGMGLGQPPEQIESDDLSDLLEELNIPQSGEALSHSVENNITDMTPEQEDAILQPLPPMSAIREANGTQIRRGAQLMTLTDAQAAEEFNT